VKKREAIAIEHIVEEAYGERNSFGQSDEVDGGVCIRSCDEVGHVDGAEGTGFIGQKRLFTAGLVDSIVPRRGVGLARLIVSRKTRPGSPLAQAASTSRSKMSCAGSRLVGLLVWGLIRA